MAMINCPECKTEVSSEAKICPKCGVRVKPSNAGAIVAGIVLLIVAAILLGAVYKPKPNFSKIADEFKVKCESMAMKGLVQLHECSTAEADVRNGKQPDNSMLALIAIEITNRK